MHNKLKQIENRIKILEDEKESGNKIDDLIYKINNLKLGDNNKKLRIHDKEMLFGKI